MALDPAFVQDSFGYAMVGPSIADLGLLICGPLGAITPQGRLRSLGQRRSREDATLAKIWKIVQPYAQHGLRLVTDVHMADAITAYFELRGVPVTVMAVSGPLQAQMFTSTRARLVDGSLRLWEVRAAGRGAAACPDRQEHESIVLPRFGNSHCDIADALTKACWDLRWVSEAPEHGAITGRSHWATDVRESLEDHRFGGSVAPTLTGGLMSQPL